LWPDKVMDDRAALTLFVRSTCEQKRGGYNIGREGIWYSQINRLELIVPNWNISGLRVAFLFFSGIAVRNCSIGVG